MLLGIGGDDTDIKEQYIYTPGRFFIIGIQSKTPYAARIAKLLLIIIQDSFPTALISCYYGFIRVCCNDIADQRLGERREGDVFSSSWCI